MEVNIEYKAKDGKVFSDPYLCESYEKALENKPGTLGCFLNTLEEFKKTDYFCGIVYYREDDKVQTLAVYSIDFSDIYEGEIVTEAMKEAQRRVSSTVGNVLEYFKDKDKSIPCCGSFVISSDIKMTNCNLFHYANKKVFQ